MEIELKKNLSKIANAIRLLSIDAVQKANSGHPGLPLGCAEIGAYLYGYALKHNPKHSKWINRDRLVLSAGHGSMWLYSCLHLAGFNLSLDEIKNFRQLHSRTPGHPEYGETDGVEATTGPLGQGTGNAVGMALGLKLLAARFNTPKHKIFDSKVFALMSDGCAMEGATSEVCSLAGHLNLDNLIVLYDANGITLDGALFESYSENTKERYKAYGWDVLEVDGHDLDALDNAISKVRQKQEHPCLIIAHTIIGKGSPNKAGSHKVHGSPLGEEEVAATKAALGLSEEAFYVPQAVRSFFEKKLLEDQALEERWKALFSSWAIANPALAKEFEQMTHKHLPEDLEKQLYNLEIKSPIAGRSASHAVINLLADFLPYLYGGSADLSGSDMTMIKKYGLIEPKAFSGRNFKFGIREFGMGTIASGLSLIGLFTPFVGTFLTFSDYMRNAIRLACLMKVQVIYQFTHDSIFLGEDGPTHQAVEHYAALRAIPRLQFIRPADDNEVKMAWIAALHYQGPTAFALSRQNLPTLPGTKVPYSEGVGRGAYIVKKETRKPDFTLLATGSELHLAFDVSVELEKHGKSVRVVSMPCWKLFEEQNEEYKKSILGGDLGKMVSIEAGVDLGWHKYIGKEGVAICMEGFGASAPAGALAKEFGFTVDAVLERLL